jgi:iron complex transport system substrate-binding protein
MPVDRGAATLLLCVAVLFVAGCEPRGESADLASSASGRVVTDADGNPIRVQPPARRVISLVPSATLTLGALGAEDRLVARTDFDTAAWVGSLPSVGGGLQPSIEAIVAARPDLVIHFGGPQDVQTPRRLEDLGIRHAAVRPDRIHDILDMVRFLGAVTGRDEAADSLALSIESELAAVRRSAAGRPDVQVAYVLGGDPPWVAGPGTYIHELIEIAGGTNTFSDLERRYAAVSPEEFHGRTIDLILLSRGTVFDARLAHGGRIVEVSPDLELPGPRVAASARELARILAYVP